MSDRCHVCGPVKHEAPTVLCARCMLGVDEDSIEIWDDPECPGRQVVSFRVVPERGDQKLNEIRDAVQSAVDGIISKMIVR